MGINYNMINKGRGGDKLKQCANFCTSLLFFYCSISRTGLCKSLLKILQYNLLGIIIYASIRGPIYLIFQGSYYTYLISQGSFDTYLISQGSYYTYLISQGSYNAYLISQGSYHAYLISQGCYYTYLISQGTHHVFTFDRSLHDLIFPRKINLSKYENKSEQNNFFFGPFLNRTPFLK